MACVVTALWQAKPDKVDRMGAVVDEIGAASEAGADSERCKRRVLGAAVPGLLEDRERASWSSDGEG